MSSLAERLAARGADVSLITSLAGKKRGACSSPRSPSLSPRSPRPGKRQKKTQAPPDAVVAEPPVTAVETASSEVRCESFDSVEVCVSPGLLRELRAEFEEGLSKGIEKGGALMAKMGETGRVELVRIEQHSYHLAQEHEAPHAHAPIHVH